jgi:hypothetical protein
MNHYSTTKPHLRILIISIILAAIFVIPVAAINNNTHIVDQMAKNNYQPVEIYDNDLYYTTTPTLTHILEYIFIEKPELTTNLTCKVYLNLAGHGWLNNDEPITVTRRINPTDTPTKLTPKGIAKQIITDITTNKTSLPDNLLIYNSEDHPYGLFIDIGKLKELYPEIQTRKFKWISTYSIFTTWNTIWGPTYHPNYTLPTPKPTPTITTTPTKKPVS